MNSIIIKDSKPIIPFESFDINEFGVLVNSSFVTKKNNLNTWTISLFCILDISQYEQLPELVKVDMSETHFCCGLIPLRTITLSPKKNNKGEETLWMITLEAVLESIDNVRIMDILVNMETRRPRAKKARTMAQALAG